MTYLQQALEKQRAVRLPEEDFTICNDGRAAALTLHTSSCKVWTLPWDGLIGAWLDQTKKPEKIVLTFSPYVVTIRGRNLDRVMVAIGSLRLESARARLDGAQASQVEMDKTVITEITVSDPEPMLGMDVKA